MSFREFGILLRHFVRLIVACALIGALTALVLSVLVTPEKYEASATITMSDPSGNVSLDNMLAVTNSLAQSSVAPYAVKGSGVKASVSLEQGISSQMLKITVDAPSPDESIALANALVNDVSDGASEVFEALQTANEEGLADLDALTTSDDVASVLSGSLLQNILGSGRTFEFCSFLTNEASETKVVGPTSLSLTVLGLLCGAFFAIIGVVAYDFVKRPLREGGQVEEKYGFPVLNGGEYVGIGDRLWANVQFAFSPAAHIDSICLVPISGNSAELCAAALTKTLRDAAVSTSCASVLANENSLPSGSKQSVVLYVCEPCSKGVGASYGANASSVTVVCARMWKDSMADLDNTIRALSMAKAHIAGFAILPEKDGEQF